MNYANDVIKILHERASCRSFLDKKIPKETFNSILEAGTNAPSSGGFQAYSIIKIEKKQTKEKLMKLSRGQKYITQAPVNLLFCIDYRRIKRLTEIHPSPFNFTDKFINLWMGIVDSTICAQNICIAAESYGLKSLYIGNIINHFDKIKEIFKLPEYVCPSLLLCLGYPQNKVNKKRKYHTDIIVHNEEYSDLDDEVLLNAFHEKNENWQMKIQDKWLNVIWRTAREFHGEEFANSCIKDIKNKGYINIYQYYFGAFYLDEEGFMDNAQYFKFMKDSKFNWMEK